MSKILKKMLRILLAGAAALYCYCIIKGIQPIDYRASENGGIVSVAGNEIEISGEEFREAAEVYEKAESRASELIPDAMRGLFDKIKNFFGFGDTGTQNNQPPDTPGYRPEDRSAEQDTEADPESEKDLTPSG